MKTFWGWDMLRTWLYALAGAVGVRSDCGHWRREFVNGRCFDCAMDQIEKRTWADLKRAIEEYLTAHPEALNERDRIGQ